MSALVIVSFAQFHVDQKKLSAAKSFFYYGVWSAKFICLPKKKTAVKILRDLCPFRYTLNERQSETVKCMINEGKMTGDNIEQTGSDVEAWHIGHFNALWTQ